MSGGSYDYVCFADASDILGGKKMDAFEEMTERICELFPDSAAAKDMRRLVVTMKNELVRVDNRLNDLRDVMKAIEWFDSSDWRIGAVTNAIEDYQDKTP